ncbi:MAG: ATP/GTP-binding protein [Methylococcaceae bacterium]|nr:ATP/GTP-binding protein [Methylococcaceae bacterium]MDD1607211.1 ATP/GTP-binding protein [Methylococcaceae bacterium]MDD1609796.1 ATP/GTP-binding protein [Methylococcaceae bacterium]MDD1615925.1 ATP/GTP-binding protein [Methylococcaceae bacterium]OYV19045.1 MAG: small GTP-binding domain protein [Methylococcaceae bacterium NSP1-2]
MLNTKKKPINDPLKIVFVGNIGSGKTTAVTAISDAPIIGSEAKATEKDALRRKLTTTVGLEYGVTHIDNTKLHIYGTPGQRRFDFMATIACKGAAGMVVLIDNGYSKPLTELDYFLQFHSEFLKNHPSVIGVTHYDDNNTETNLIEYHNYVLTNGFSSVVMRLDAREKNQVQKVVKQLHTKIVHCVN